MVRNFFYFEGYLKTLFFYLFKETLINNKVMRCLSTKNNFVNMGCHWSCFKMLFPLTSCKKKTNPNLSRLRISYKFQKQKNVEPYCNYSFGCDPITVNKNNYNLEYKFKLDCEAYYHVVDIKSALII